MIDHSTAQEITGGVESVPGLVHHCFEVCDGPLSVYEAGDATQPCVVMLHGAMYDESRLIWDQLFPFLSSSYHLYAIDTPRHGKSRPWQGFLSRERLMEILEVAIAHLGLERFSMVGLSMGGALCIDFAARHPEKVVSMALFKPGGLGETVDSQFITWLYIKTPGLLRYLNKRYVKKDRTGVFKVLESLYVGGSKPTDPDRLAGILEDEIQGKHKYAENDLDDWQLSAMAPFKLKWNLLDTIPLIQCPTLWLRGAQSVLVKQHEMERAVELTVSSNAGVAKARTELRTGARTGASLLVIENAGHMLPLEQPEQANIAVKEFLDKNT